MKKQNRNKTILLQICLMIFTLKLAGQTVTDFELKNVDGNMISLSSYIQKKAVVIIFTGNHCVYSKKYEDRLITMSKQYAEAGVQFLMINSNNPKVSEDETFELMVARAKEKGFPFPYLQDADHVVSKMLGATKNPEAFLLIPEGKTFRISYHGNIDDNALMAEKVSQKYLKNAIDKALASEVVDKAVTETVGCSIREL